jgi:hypothetical protein
MKALLSRSLLLLAGSLTLSGSAYAHCDTLDGPVVASARQALSEADAGPVLRWIRPDDEPEVQTAFARTLAVRQTSAEAAALADTYFFETLVRLHRAGEGAPYTGLKATVGNDLERAADEALQTGSIEPLANDLLNRIKSRLAEKFARAREREAHADHNVDAGRQAVAAYVDYVHFIDAVGALVNDTQSTAAAHQH